MYDLCRLYIGKDEHWWSTRKYDLADCFVTSATLLLLTLTLFVTLPYNYCALISFLHEL